MSVIGAVILAAGGSQRLGRPKQLLAYAGTSLLQHMVGVVAGAGLRPLVVVTGKHYPLLAHASGDGVVEVHNPDWTSGISSSIRSGLTALCSMSADVSACILLVCDQPFIHRGLLYDLTEKYRQTGKGIIASAYAGTFGTPVLFAARYFPELLNLRGDEGAKKIIRLQERDREVVLFNRGEVDIDTEADYEELMTGIMPGEPIQTAGENQTRL